VGATGSGRTSDPCQSTATIRHHPPSSHQRQRAKARACARVALGPATVSAAGPFRRLPTERSSSSLISRPMSRVYPHPCLSAVFECRSLSRCRTRMRRRIGGDPKFLRCRAWGRTGGTGSLPSGSITRLSGRTAHFDHRTDHINFFFPVFIPSTIMFLMSLHVYDYAHDVLCVYCY